MADDAAARLYQAFVSEDPAAAIAVIERAKAGGVAQAQLFDSLFAPAMSLLGGAWAAGAIDEYTFTQAAVVAEQIASFVTPPATAQDTGVTVLIGTMHRDYHAIDKNIIGAALKEAGHRVDRPGCRRAAGRVPRAARGDRRPTRDRVREHDGDRPSGRRACARCSRPPGATT